MLREHLPDREPSLNKSPTLGGPLTFDTSQLLKRYPPEHHMVVENYSEYTKRIPNKYSTNTQTIVSRY